MEVVQARMASLSSLVSWQAVLDCGLKEQIRQCHLMMQESCVVARGSCEQTWPRGVLHEGISVNLRWQWRCWRPCEVEAPLRAWCWLISTANMQDWSTLFIPVKTAVPSGTMLLHWGERLWLLQGERGGRVWHVPLQVCSVFACMQKSIKSSIISWGPLVAAVSETKAVRCIKQSGSTVRCTKKNKNKNHSL